MDGEHCISENMRDAFKKTKQMKNIRGSIRCV